MIKGLERRTLLIGSSCFISLIIIGVAYTSSGPTPFTTQRADAESTHDLLVSYASKDSDADGLPDWQEALYNTDPNNAHSVNASVTDSEAVAQGLVEPKFKTATTTAISGDSIPAVDAGPETLTDQFGKALFGKYLQNRGGTQPSPADIATFVEQGIAQFKEKQITPDAFNQGQMRVNGTGPDSLLTYAATAEQVLALMNTGKEKTDIEYMSDAVYRNDTKAIVEIKKYGDAYKVAAQALIKIPVPKELARSHLSLANTLMHVSESTLDMASISTDPLRSLLGMATYVDAASAMGKSLADMRAVYSAEHVIPATGTAGRDFYELMTTAASLKK